MCYFLPLRFEDAIWKVPDGLTKSLTKEEVGTVRFIAAYVAKVFPHLNLTLRLETGSVFKGPQKCKEYSSRTFFCGSSSQRLSKFQTYTAKTAAVWYIYVSVLLASPKSAGCKILPDLCFYISESRIYFILKEGGQNIQVWLHRPP